LNDKIEDRIKELGEKSAQLEAQIRLAEKANFLAKKHREKLNELKAAARDLDQPDWLWHSLLASASTLGNSRGYRGLIENEKNYNKVTFDSLAKLSKQDRGRTLSLIEQYEFKAYGRKREVVKRLLPPEVFTLVTDHKPCFGGVQCPDLLTYSPDYSDWFFCEVKGPGDRLQKSQLRRCENNCIWGYGHRYGCLQS
jgi:hypothetical protein